MQRHARYRHHALLVPLANDREKAVFKTQVGKVEPHQLAHAQTAAVQHLENRPVTQGNVTLPKRCDLFHQRIHLLDGKHIRQMLLPLRQRKARSRIALAYSLPRKKLMETLKHRHATMNGRGRIASALVVDFARDEILLVSRHVFAGDLRHLRNAPLLKKGKVVVEVGTVRLDSERRRGTLDRKIEEVFPARVFQCRIHAPSIRHAERGAFARFARLRPAHSRICEVLKIQTHTRMRGTEC